MKKYLKEAAKTRIYHGFLPLLTKTDILITGGGWNSIPLCILIETLIN